MDTIVDKALTGAWQSAYTLSGLSVGVALVIQNKSVTPCLIFIQAAAPSSSSSDGWMMMPGESVEITAGETGCWLKGKGPLSIQAGV